MKNLIKVLIASALVLGYTAVAAGGSAFGGGGSKATKISSPTLIAAGGSAFTGGG